MDSISAPQKSQLATCKATRFAVEGESNFLIYPSTRSDDGQPEFLPKALILCLLFGPTDDGERFYANQYKNPRAVAAAEMIKAALRIARWYGVTSVSQLGIIS
jgi:hypothetical protein